MKKIFSIFSFVKSQHFITCNFYTGTSMETIVDTINRVTSMLVPQILFENAFCVGDKFEMANFVIEKGTVPATDSAT